MIYTIIAIWLAAAVVSMPPLLGVKDPEYELRLQMGRCLMSQDVHYQIFATMSTFYVPSVVILFLYWKIYQVRVHLRLFFVTFNSLKLLYPSDVAYSFRFYMN